jgi:hypothetical protein
MAAGTVKFALSGYVWAKKKCSFNGGGLLIEVDIGTRPSFLIEVVTRVPFHYV